MKFKRNLNVYLKGGQSLNVPNDEFWKFSIFLCEKGSIYIVDNNNDFLRFGGMPNLSFGGGAKVVASSTVYITGAAFTAD